MKTPAYIDLNALEAAMRTSHEKVVQELKSRDHHAAYVELQTRFFELQILNQKILATCTNEETDVALVARALGNTLACCALSLAMACPDVWPLFTAAYQQAFESTTSGKVAAGSIVTRAQFTATTGGNA
ncbi:hypothetical protein [Ferrovibrio sp.]|uniref:hypothetical protein n=1 Tax=Ferrovibrio sp. TaxID=1917215 RepID=UPI0025BDC28D|nr:hypothetical protein [Ferrovibrio sp.]MBX3455804.1 hypothetical protein [Ferrovibrio sp.]